MRQIIFLFLSLASFGHFTIVENEEVKFIAFNENNFNAIVLKNGVRVCAGALIAKTSLYDVVITAAHCVYPALSNRISIQVGNSVVEAQHVIVYPHYAPPSVDYDIAIIKFISTKPQTFESISTAQTPPLSDTEPKTGTLMEIYVKDSNNNQWNLKTEMATMEDRQNCKSKYQGIVPVTNRIICAFSKNPSIDGSPLMFNKTVVGITSKPSRNGTLPTLYTSMAHLSIRNFIYSYL